MNPLFLVYSFGFWVLSLPVAGLFLLTKRGRAHWGERFGGWKLNRELDGCIWVHAASVGEVRGIASVVAKLRAQELGPVLITTTSPEGRANAEQQSDFAKLVPFDSWTWYRRAWGKARPKLLVVNETELWPGMLGLMRLWKVPVVIINGRISKYALGNYQRAKGLWRRLFRLVERILVVDRTSAERFESIGAQTEQIKVVGNSKYDSAGCTDQEVRAEQAEPLGGEGPLLVLGSLRPGEEKVWFKAIQSAVKGGLRFRVLLAPRHLNKCGHFFEALNRSGIYHQGWTGFARSELFEDSVVVVLDTMGELAGVYQHANLAFVGGTLVEFGGHTPMEAAAASVGVVVGPHIDVIEDVVSVLKQEGGVLRVYDESDCERLIQDLVSDPDRFKELGINAHKAWTRYQGVSDIVVSEIREILNA